MSGSRRVRLGVGLLLACLLAAAWLASIGTPDAGREPPAPPAHAARLTASLAAARSPASRVWASDLMFNDVARQSILGVEPAWRLGLYGAGQIIAVADTGLDTGDTSTLSRDFAGRIVQAYAWGRPDDWSDAHGHGTHVAGSALGSGALSGSDPAAHRYDGSLAGVAPEAGLVIQSLLDAEGGLGGLPDDLAELLGQAYDAGARIHTNSWGGNLFLKPLARYLTACRYDEPCVQVDRFVWEHPDLVVLFAAGNEGIDLLTPGEGSFSLPPPDGVVDPESLSSPGSAKNIITVGASEGLRSEGGHATEPWGGEGDLLSGLLGDSYTSEPLASDLPSDDANGMAPFSSRGPTHDGRIKPDVVAPGTDIVSARSHVTGASELFGAYDDNYAYCSGTSMSTPLVAGVVAIIREWYVTRRGVANPSAALIKATLINGTVDIRPGQFGPGPQQDVPDAWPNPVSGWGRVSLAGSIAPADGAEVWFLDERAGLTTGEEAINVRYAAAGAEPLRVTLVWTDPPGPLEPEGIYLPGLAQEATPVLVNDLDLVVETPDGQTYYGNMGAELDKLNNVEAVRVPEPEAGEYRITVRGQQVAQGPQPFALVIAGQRVVSGPEEASDVEPAAGSEESGSDTGWVVPLFAGIGVVAVGLAGGSVALYRAQARRARSPAAVHAVSPAGRGQAQPAPPRGAAGGASGTPLATLRAESGPLNGQTFAVDCSPWVIGRSADNNLAVPEAPISRRHAQLELYEGRWFLRDLDSSNGTFLNRQRLSGAQPLHSGDLIGLGETVLAFTAHSAAGAGVRPVARPPVPIRGGARRPARWLVALAVGLVLLVLVVAAVLLVGGLEARNDEPSDEPGLPGIPLPSGLPAIPSGIPALPTGVPVLSTDMPTLPTGMPTGMPALPTGMPALPTGLPALPVRPAQVAPARGSS